jgi:hypothetical protein
MEMEEKIARHLKKLSREEIEKLVVEDKEGVIRPIAVKYGLIPEEAQKD